MANRTKEMQSYDVPLEREHQLAAGHGSSDAEGGHCVANDNKADAAGLNQHSICSTDAIHRPKIDDGEPDLEPALKRLRCQTSQIKPILILPQSDQGSSDIATSSTEKNQADRRQCDVLSSADDESKLHGTQHPGKQDTGSKLDENLAECTTPTAREHRISGSQHNLVCPSPPRKKKPTSFKRNPRSSSQCRRLLLNPPDLDSFPDCIRALFDK